MTTPTLPLPTLATYRLQHIWSTGTDADTSAYDEVHYSRPPGVTIDGIGRSQIRAFGPPNTPTLEDTLSNIDGIYSPGGVLGGFVGRGPITTFDADWGSDVDVDADDVEVDDPVYLVDGISTKRLFSGNISTAPQQIDNPASVQIRSLGTIRKLGLVKPIIPLNEGITTGAAVALVADACDWDADARRISDGNTTLLRFWGDGKTDGITLLNMITGAEGVPACWWVDPEGDVLIWEDRVERQNATRSNTIQYTFFDGPVGTGDATVDDPTVFVDDPNIFVDGPVAALTFHTVPSQWTSNPDEVVSTVTATINVRTPTLTMKIWEYGGPLVLTSNQVLDIPIYANDPFKDAIVPALGTDYLVASGSLVSVSLTQTSGQATTLRFVADVSGATVNGATSAGPQFRAVSLPVTTATPVTATVTDDLSAARFEPKPYTIQLWPEITFNQALDLTNSFKRRYRRPRDQMVIRLVANLDAAHMYAVFSLRISDRIRIVHTRANIEASFYAETIHHDLSAGGGLHVMLIGCERVTDDIPSRYGDARYGFSQYSQ